MAHDMTADVRGTFRRCLVKGAVCAAALALTGSVSAQPAGSRSIPDFSGFFAQNTSVYQEPADGGRGPLGYLPGHEVPPGGRATVWVGNHLDPMLQPHNAVEVKRLSDMEASGGVNLTAYQLCRLLGVPLILTQRENIQLLQKPDRITIIYQRDSQVRHIYLNVPHSENVQPSWYGESVGHYEGDTLVVDTIGQNGLSRVDRFGSLASEALHVTERYRVIDGGQRLQVDIAVEDPNSITEPWYATQYYRRTAGQWEEDICAENNRDARTGQDYEGMPIATRADF